MTINQQNLLLIFTILIISNTSPKDFDGKNFSKTKKEISDEEQKIIDQSKLTFDSLFNTPTIDLALEQLFKQQQISSRSQIMRLQTFDFEHTDIINVVFIGFSLVIFRFFHLQMIQNLSL